MWGIDKRISILLTECVDFHLVIILQVYAHYSFGGSFMFKISRNFIKKDVTIALHSPNWISYLSYMLMIANCNITLLQVFSLTISTCLLKYQSMKWILCLMKHHLPLFPGIPTGKHRPTLKLIDLERPRLH